jgi:hypothetical protein
MYLSKVACNALLMMAATPGLDLACSDPWKLTLASLLLL